jgi:hypothetical protein
MPEETNRSGQSCLENERLIQLYVEALKALEKASEALREICSALDVDPFDGACTTHGVALQRFVQIRERLAKHSLEHVGCNNPLLSQDSASR